MKIRKFLFGCMTAALSLFGLTATACGGDDEPDTPTPSGPVSMSISPTSLTIEGGDTNAHNVTVTTSKQATVTVTSSASWCTVYRASASGTKTVYEVSLTENGSADERTCTVKFMANGKEGAVLNVTQKGVKPVTPDVPDTPDASANFLGLGWNLGNQMDSWANEMPSETAWGNQPATQATFNALKAAGFTSVRIPVTWMNKVGAAPDYKIDEAWLNRVAELVGYAENAGLKVILNIHHDGADSKHWLNIKSAALSDAVNTSIKNQLKAMWTQIAKKFAGKGDFLVFESMNEIHDGGWGWGDNRKDGGKQYKVFNEWQQVFVDAVRYAGGVNNSNRWLAIPTYCTNIDLGDNLVMPTDPVAKGRLMVAVHCYEPYEYTLNNKYTEWGHTGASGKKPSGSDEKTLVAEFDKIVNKWISKGIPAYIGEFGCVHRDNTRAENFRKYYLEYFTKAAADRKIPIVYWDNGSTGTGHEAGGLINHATGAWINNGKEITDVMTKGYFTTDASYTLESVYNNAPK